MPPARPRRTAAKEQEAKRLGWKKVRVSYFALKIWAGVFAVALVAAAGSVIYARSQGTESFIGRIFSIARQSIDRRIKLMSDPTHGESDLLEQRYAMLSFFSGSVKIQRSNDLGWRDATENMRLASGDRVRTFASARADVSFDDGNILRIKPDSLIVIGDLTENVRTKVKKSSVRLLVSNIEADVKKSVVRGSEFRLEMPNATAEIEKARLAIEIRPDRQSQVRVYSGAVAIDTGQQKVQLTDRQTAMISALKQVTTPENLLPPPRVNSPSPLATFPTTTGGVVLDCDWAAVPGASTYRLEVASDRFFDQVVVAGEDLDKTAFQTPAISSGIYYLRVAGFDSRGRLGDFSEPVPFRVTLDRVPPFIEIQKFVVLQTGRGREVLVNGRTEPSATLTVGGQAVVVDAGGYFSAVIRVVGSAQTALEITVRDRAGNVRTMTREVTS